MADYRMSCCGGFTQHDISCSLNSKNAEWKKRVEYIALMRGYGFILIDDKLGLFGCRRGCGTVVWNPETHMKNVCTTFSPVAGSE